jgi:hypothetical protein
MSDFDEVLERLLADPVFQAALQANPEAALAGYRLEPDERRLLDTQLDRSPGEERTVELRISKSGVMGMVGPVVSAFGMAGGNPTEASGQGAFGLAPRDEGMLDPGSPTQTFGSVHATEVFGLSDSPGSSAPPPVEAVGYHTSVDVDGDGHWDSTTAYERGDGGVDIRADVNHDGVTDFVGHDFDRDGLVDSADYDTNNDGVLDTRMYDDNGDGWMDRSSALPPPQAQPPGDVQTFGQAPQSK